MLSRDIQRLEEAVMLLEYPSWTARITDIIGMPVEWAVKRLPDMANRMISGATTKAIRKALEIAVATLEPRHRGEPRKIFHKGAVTLSGAVGGFFGLGGLAVELPASTTIMLRSIAEIAKSLGEDVNKLDTQLNCMSVFALGSKRRASDDAAETGYFAVRAVLAKLISETSGFIAERGLVEEGAPVIVRFIVRIASRFEVIISEKAAAQAVPVIGAASGAAINYLFMDHFQSIATGHFTVRALERQYGTEAVQAEYARIKARLNIF